MSENKIYITDEDGKETEMNILCTFDMEEHNYAVLYATDHEDDLYAFRYDEEGHLYAVEDEEELSIVQEVVGAFLEETDDEESD